MPVLDRRSDTVKQQDALTAARADLRLALATLQSEVKHAWRALGHPQGQPDLLAVYAATQTVKDCEEGVDFATHDLSTASGEHA